MLRAISIELRSLKFAPRQWSGRAANLALAKTVTPERSSSILGRVARVLGLESISQLSPAMRLPILSTAKRACAT